MKGDLNPAALRLSALPCVTHMHDFGPARGENMKRNFQAFGKRKPTISNPAIKKISTGHGRGGQNRKPFVFRGRTYNGINEAAAKLHKSPHTIRKWLYRGEAVYT